MSFTWLHVHKKFYLHVTIAFFYEFIISLVLTVTNSIDGFFIAIYYDGILSVIPILDNVHEHNASIYIHFKFYFIQKWLLCGVLVLILEAKLNTNKIKI